MKCSLCGLEFDPASQFAQSKCRDCPLGQACRMVCCPNCGYNMPRPRKKEKIVRHENRETGEPDTGDNRRARNIQE